MPTKELFSGTKTASGNGEDIDVSEFNAIEALKSGIFVLDVTAKAGTSPTLTVTIENKDPISGKYDTAVTFAQKTAEGTEWKYGVDSNKSLGEKIRVKWVIGGSSPSFTFTVSLTSKKSPRL